MSKTEYSSSQIEELLENKYVAKCSSRYITFTQECKIVFIKMHKRGIFYREIFSELGFPKYIVKSQLPERCSQRWRKVFREHGFLGFTQEKGRPKKEKLDLSSMSLQEQNEYLRAEVAYLKEVQKLSGKYP